ncbi:MAG: hypothetical protein QM488_15930 [Rhizobiaceae bacterium]
MKLSTKTVATLAIIGTTVIIIAATGDPAMANPKEVSGLDLGSGRFWEWLFG